MWQTCSQMLQGRSRLSCWNTWDSGTPFGTYWSSTLTSSTQVTCPLSFIKETNKSSQVRAHDKYKCKRSMDVIVTCAYIYLQMSQSVSLFSTLRNSRQQHFCSARAMPLVGTTAASDFGNEVLSIEITSILVPKCEAPTQTRTANGNRANVNKRAQSEQIAAGHIAVLDSHLCRFCEQCISYCCLSTYSSA